MSFQKRKENPTGEASAAARASPFAQPELEEVDVFLNPVTPDYKGPVLLFNPQSRQYFTDRRKQLIGGQEINLFGDPQIVMVPRNRQTEEFLTILKAFFNSEINADSLTFVEAGERVQYYKVYVDGDINIRNGVRLFKPTRIGILGSKDNTEEYTMCLSLDEAAARAKSATLYFGIENLIEAPDYISNAYMSFFGIDTPGRDFMGTMHQYLQRKELSLEQRKEYKKKNPTADVDLTTPQVYGSLGNEIDDEYFANNRFGGNIKKRKRKTKKRRTRRHHLTRQRKTVCS